MIVRTLPVGTMGANCYILECEKSRSAIVIDPGDEGDRILDSLNKHNLQVMFIINTHAHVDHIAANAKLKEGTSAPLCIHSAGADALTDPQRNLSLFTWIPVSSPEPDRLLEEGDILQAGTLRLRVMHTPGHSPESICLLDDKSIFTGDLLFAGGIGRYDFPGSSYMTLMESLVRVMKLDDDMTVYPGHGPATTIGDERRTNPFLQIKSA